MSRSVATALRTREWPYYLALPISLGERKVAGRLDHVTRRCAEFLWSRFLWVKVEVPGRLEKHPEVT